MRRLTPQQKKDLSYAKDRRNAYGQNDKASRKIIPLRKRLVNRVNRHDAARLLSNAVGVSPDTDIAEVSEQRLAGKLPKSWRKRPDRSLREHAAERLARRKRDGA